MEIKNERYKGEEAYILENEFLKVIVLKSFGAKIASIYYKKQRFEVLFQSVKDEYAIPKYGDSFEKYDTSGWDEMFPTIDKCEYPYDTKHKGIEMPDHGELWSISWSFTIEGEGLKAVAVSPKFDYIFTRYICLNESTIHAKYEIKNIGEDSLYGLWAFHGLLACDEQSKLLLYNVHEIVNVHESDELGKVGTVHNYPLTKNIKSGDYHLDKIKPASAKKTEKFYVNGELLKGEAGITLNKGNLSLIMQFPKEKLPYLGVWINEGGFKDEYNCAIEPASGFYDSVEIAKKYNKIRKIKAGEVDSWFLDLTLKEI